LRKWLSSFFPQAYNHFSLLSSEREDFLLYPSFQKLQGVFFLKLPWNFLSPPSLVRLVIRRLNRMSSLIFLDPGFSLFPILRYARGSPSIRKSFDYCLPRASCMPTFSLGARDPFFARRRFPYTRIPPSRRKVVFFQIYGFSPEPAASCLRLSVDPPATRKAGDPRDFLILVSALPLPSAIENVERR